MTGWRKRTIMEMAQEAGLSDERGWIDAHKAGSELEAFAKLVRADALAQPAPVQEPVAFEYFRDWMVREMPSMTIIGNPEWWAKRIYDRFIYTTPPQRTWVGLTNDEVNDFAAGCHLGNSVQGAIYKAEAKLKEKNT